MSHDTDESDTDESDTEAATAGSDGSRTRSEWEESRRPSTAIVEAVAAATDRDPTALSPLQRHVDADALDTLLTAVTSTAGESVRVSFEYEGFEVVVGGDGGIEVRAGDTEHERFTANPRTDSELNAMLQGLLRVASQNGVSVSGGWTVRNGAELPDWDVHITRVGEPGDSGSG